ncbi:MAG: tetratricopeptide repeat protein [Isosphaerales bacterium]
MNATSRNAKAIFVAALKLAPDQWDSHLAEACGEDDELRGRVRDLLHANAEAGSFLESPASGPGTTVDQPIREGPGTAVGPYKLLQQIGEGGMGTVFMAEQDKPVRRKVALKVIKAGMDSRQVIARFEAERQALAMMDHINIARVHDAGTTDTGQPFFVMELVHGVPITKYCDDNHLTPRERLELFVPVCQAIQHAHQKGIIHRDVKPSNVMVTLYDGRPVPKVIDFGVAKATEQPLTERTLFTQYGTMIGTLEYMSPEQAQMSALGVDTRSDIYSLGVLLYELLAGSTPLSHKRIKEAAYGEILRMIKEEEPPKPSTRLSDSGEALASISAQRHMEPAKLAKLVRGELDWIVMKCLEKDRNRRYETANGFAADVQRYLNDEPVLACPPSAGYRFRKFARRNKRALVTALLLGLVLLAAVGTVAGSIGWVARDRAVRQLTMEAGVNLALNEAERFRGGGNYPEALSAAKRADVLLADDAASQGLQERVRHVRKDLEMILRLEGILFDLTSLKQNPLWFDFVKLDSEYAQAFRDYGIDVEALEPAKAGELIRDRPIRLQLALALDAWAEARRYTLAAPVPAPPQGKSWEQLLAAASAADPDPWRVRMRGVLQKRNREALVEVAAAGPLHDVPALTLGLLARALSDHGAHEQAETLLRRAQRRHPTSFWLNYDLAKTLLRQEPPRRDQAIRFLSVALALRPNSPAVYAMLCRTLGDMGAWEEAAALCQEAVRVNADSAVLHLFYGNALGYQGKEQQAIPEYRKAIALQPDYAEAHSSLGTALAKTGRLDEAIVAHQEAIRLKGPDHPDTLNMLANLANTYGDLGRHSDALKLREATLALTKAKLGPDHPHTLMSMNNLASSYYALGRYCDALKLCEQTLALRKVKLGPDHPQTLMSMNSLAIIFAALGRHADALKLREATLALRKAKLGPDHPDTLLTTWHLAESLVKFDRGAEALPIIDECLQRAAGKDVHPGLQASVMELRLRHFEKSKDAAGCQATAEMWEKLKRTDATSLYEAACCRAVAAAVFRATDKSGSGAKKAAAEADRAMAWLKQAAAGGYNNLAHMKQDTDLEILRERDDFKKLMAKLERKN